MNDPTPDPCNPNLRRISPADLLAALPLANRQNGHKPSPANTSSPSLRAANCAHCENSGQILEELTTARDAGLIVLESYRLGDRAIARVPCQCAAGARIIAAWQRLPSEARDVTLGSLMALPDQDQAQAACEWFIASPSGWLTFGGAYGTGKSTLIYACLNELAAVGMFGRYTTAPELIDLLRTTIRNGGDPDAILQRYIGAPVLAVDELDKYDPTEFAEKTIFRLFDARYRAKLEVGTLLAYNLDRSDRLPPFLRSRMDDGRFHHIRLGGADVRPAMGGDAWDRGEP